VLVNAPDPAVAAQPIITIAKLAEEFSTIADFSEIVRDTIKKNAVSPRFMLVGRTPWSAADALVGPLRSGKTVSIGHRAGSR